MSSTLSVGKPFFSIVIASYNSASWIVATVRSALDQSWPDREIIVVGDGTTDETADLLAKHFGNAIRWKNLDRNTGGQSYPNNEGIRLSRGTHVAYLGHDDIWSRHHLAQLAEVIGARDPDFAVSGAVYHGPPGSRFYQINGIFDHSERARTEFFPPSSFAHRRDVVDRIGFWCDPSELRAPADCDFLLRAVSAGCRFASTKTITVHKFAAGHRYLAYRFPCGTEQQRMLERLRTPEAESALLDEIRNDIADGADSEPSRYVDFDCYAPGDLYRRSRGIKGLAATSSTLVDRPRTFNVEAFAAALDWHDVEEHPALGLSFRWSGPNPNPRYLLNVRLSGPFKLRVHVLGFAADDLADSLELYVNEQEVQFARREMDDGTHVLMVAPIEGHVEDGLVLRFRLPRSERLANDPAGRRAGLALSSIEVVPLRCDARNVADERSAHQV